MKKRLLKLIFIGLSITSMAFLSFKMYHKLEEKRVADANTTVLPSFSFYIQDGSLFTTDRSSYANEKVVINYFNPDCDHCQYMARQIKKTSPAFTGITILMVTNADSLSVSSFVKKYGLENIPGIILLRDPEYSFNRLFGSSIVPSFFLYKNRALVRKITGETKVENLIAF